MSFGFGVGDFITVGKLVWDVYSAYADAPEQFRNFSQEILSLHAVFEQVEEQLCNTTTLSTKNTHNLKTLYDGLQGIMEELDALLKKYQSLSENPSISFDRLKWGQGDLVGLRERLRSNITLLTAFNTSLANCQLIGIQQQLGQILVAGGLHHRRSVASLHSIASFALSIGQRKAWTELSKELHCNGITAEMIKAKKEKILKLFRTGSILSFSGNADGALQEPEINSTQGKQGKEVDRRPFDAMMEVLSPPATQARNFVARLVGRKSALHVAAAKGQTNLVKVLLDRGANINATNADWPWWTALHHAASDGHVEVVKILLDRGATIDTIADYKGTALHQAADRGHTEVVEVLLDKGAPIDAMADGTALHNAAGRGHIGVVKILLDRGAAIDATTDIQSTALHRAARGGHIEVMKLLLDRGAAVDATDYTKSSTLHWAADGGHIEAVELLLDKGAAIDATNYTESTALHCVAHGGHIEVVKLLLDRGAVIDATNDTKPTALHWAADAGHIEVVKVLLDKGAPIDAMADETALHKAAGRGHIEVVKVLLDRGASIDATSVKGQTALHVACASMDRPPYPPPRRPWDADTNASRIKLVQVLLKKVTITSYSIIDVADKSGDTALHCATRFLDSNVVQQLLDNGATIDQKNERGETALDIARRRGWKRGVTLLTSTAQIDKSAHPVV